LGFLLMPLMDPFKLHFLC